MKRLGLVVWWLGPWAGLAFFAWRQQTLEQNLATWVDATNKMVQGSMARFADAAAEFSQETEHGRVTDR